MNEKTKDILKNIGKVVSGIISVLAILICFSIKWMLELQMNEDSNYTTDINMKNFGVIPGDYNMHVYVITGDGEQYFMGGGLEHVE